jgi:hypothetical protein
MHMTGYRSVLWPTLVYRVTEIPHSMPVGAMDADTARLTVCHQGYIKQLDVGYGNATSSQIISN